MKATLKLAGLLIAGLAFVAQAHAASTPGLPIKGSKHDFTISYVGSGQGAKTLCSTCHEMHKPVKMKPLWARNNPDANLVWTVKKGVLPDVYTNPLYDANTTYTKGGSLIPKSAFVDSRSGLCLSCHDGTQPVSNGMYISGSPTTTSPNFGGSDLSRNHSIGIERYSPDYYGNIVPPEVLKLNDVVSITNVNGITKERYFLGCTTCHGIHSSVPTNPKLLRNDFATNSGPVCWNCHTGK